MHIEYEWNDSDGKTQRNTCHIATLSTTVPTWSGQGLNLCLQGEKATTVLTHMKALCVLLILLKLYSFHSYAYFANMITIKIPCVRKSVGPFRTLFLRV